MATKPTKAQQIATLQRQLREALAGQVHNYHFASHNLPKASTDKLMGSGVVLTLTVLGGREICDPVLIRDGLSADTIAALQADIRRSYDQATVFKPKV